MTMQRDIAVIVGSLRKGSFNRMAANALIALAPPTLKLEIVEIRELSLYDQDLDAASPAPWVAFRERVKRADGVIFVTPEYNRSIPGVLKNAIDIGTRPPGQSVWGKKPAGVVSASPGAMGGFGASWHLRQVLAAIDMPTLPQPEIYLASAATLFDAEGRLINEKTQGFLRKFLDAYAGWVELHAGR